MYILHKNWLVIWSSSSKIIPKEWEEVIMTNKEEDKIIKNWLYKILKEWDSYKIVARDETSDELRVKYETQIQDIESQMPILRTQRDGLEETITYGLEAPWDTTKLEAIKTQLVALATQRKELYEKIAELDF